MKENREERQRPRKPQEKTRRLPGQDAYEWVQALVCSVLTVVMIFTFAIRLIGVDGHSMVPTLQDTDRLVVLSPILYHNYKAGDIVVLRKDTFSAEPIVKRVIAVEGAGRALYQRADLHRRGHGLPPDPRRGGDLRHGR